MVRSIWFFGLAPSAQPQEPEGEEARHLVEALGGGHGDGVEGLGHVRVGSVPVDYRADLANAGPSAR